MFCQFCAMLSGMCSRAYVLPTEQMYCALGKQSQALEAVGQLCHLAPEDADVHALHLLLLKAQGITGHDQASIAGEACHQLLLCDPSAHR